MKFFFSLQSASREKKERSKDRKKLTEDFTSFPLHLRRQNRTFQSERTLARLLDRRPCSTAALAASLLTEKLPGALSPLSKRQQRRHWGGGGGGLNQQQEAAAAVATNPAELPSASDLAAADLLERDRRKAACISAARCLALFGLQQAEMNKRRTGFSAPSSCPSHLTAPPPPPLPLLSWRSPLLALADSVETALTPLLASMEHRGVLVDVATLVAERAFLKKVQSAAVERLRGLAGERASRLAVRAAAGAFGSSSSPPPPPPPSSSSGRGTSSSNFFASPVLRRLADAARDRARAQVGSLNLDAPADVSQLLFDWLGLRLAPPGAGEAAAAAAANAGGRRDGGAFPRAPLPPPPPPPAAARRRGAAAVAASVVLPTNARTLAPLAARGEPGVLLVQAWRGARKREEEVQFLLDRCQAAVAVVEMERRRKRQDRRRTRGDANGGGGANDLTKTSAPLLCRLSICLRQTAAAGGRLIVDTPSLQTLPKAIDYSIAFKGDEGVGGGGAAAAAAVTTRATAISTSAPTPAATPPAFVSNVRNAVVPPRGGLLVSADYAQMELHLAAHLYADEALLACFDEEDGEGEGEVEGAAARDPMRVVAAAVFFHRPDEVAAAAAAAEEEKICSSSASLSLPSSSSLPATLEAIDAVTPQQRDAAKRLVYGLMYGMGDAALADALRASSEAEAAKVRERVGAALPGLAAWMEGIDGAAALAAAEAGLGFGAGGGGVGGGGGGRAPSAERCAASAVATLCGRAWRAPASGSAGSVEGRARSFVVQGSASDVFKRALLAVDEAFRSGGRARGREGKGRGGLGYGENPPRLSLPAGAARVLLPLHDEILVEIADERHARAAAALMREKMEGVARDLGLRVALPVKVKAGARWGEMKEGGW